jgi:elongator complex protein 4
VHSQTLISTGLADLDRILGGGLPLGAVLLLLEDAYCPHGSTLLKYFAAEGVACGHRVHWGGATRPDASSLPSLAKSHFASQVSSHISPEALFHTAGFLLCAMT